VAKRYITDTHCREVRYTLRDNDPPFVESTVTFTIIPTAIGGTHLQTVHEPEDVSFDRMAGAAANSIGPPLMLAA
jgi:uncharacterized protein YndB with AHSA1/START domain